MHVPLSALPAWPQWKFRESSEPDSAFVDADGRIAIHSDGLYVTCRLDSATAAAVRLGTFTPRQRLPQAEWPMHGIAIDMNPHASLSVIGERYREALFGAPLEVFAKTGLARARIRGAAALEAQLRKLLRTPVELDVFYSAPPEEFAARVDREGKSLRDALDLLLRRESQLQVIICLELLGLGASDAEPVLDHHFDRLTIWQALQVNSTSVKEFCMQVLLPYFRSVAPEKTADLLRRARGVSHSAEISRSRRRQSRDPSQATVATQSLLFKAIADQSPEEFRKELKAVPNSPDRPEHAMRQRTVEVSFRRKSQPAIAGDSRMRHEQRKMRLKQRNTLTGTAGVPPSALSARRAKSVPLVPATPRAVRQAIELQSNSQITPTSIDWGTKGSFTIKASGDERDAVKLTSPHDCSQAQDDNNCETNRNEDQIDSEEEAIGSTEED